MPARIVQGSADAWRRVADCARARRLALGIDAAELVERAGRGLSLAGLSRIENAKRDNYSERTINALCRGLGWTPDSVERIIRGDEPVVSADAVPLVHVEGERKETLEEAVARLQREVDRLTAIVEAQQSERQGERA